jgi:hypothetical protein
VQILAAAVTPASWRAAVVVAVAMAAAAVVVAVAVVAVVVVAVAPRDHPDVPPPHLAASVLGLRLARPQLQTMGVGWQKHTRLHPLHASFNIASLRVRPAAAVAGQLRLSCLTP